jgi:hypothetical protein
MPANPIASEARKVATFMVPPVLPLPPFSE